MVGQILICQNVYETEETLKKALDNFYSNFEIKDISYQYFYYNGKEYQNTYIIIVQHEQFEYKINLELIGSKEHVIINGYGFINLSENNYNLSNNEELLKIIEKLFSI